MPFNSLDFSVRFLKGGKQTVYAYGATKTPTLSILDITQTPSLFFFLFSGGNSQLFVYYSFKEHLLSNVVSHTCRDNVNVYEPNVPTLEKKVPTLATNESQLCSGFRTQFGDSDTRCW